jgi:hypothetical protein
MGAVLVTDSGPRSLQVKVVRPPPRSGRSTLTCGVVEGEIGTYEEGRTSLHQGPGAGVAALSELSNTRSGPNSGAAGPHLQTLSELSNKATGPAPRPLTSGIRGAPRRTEGVVQRTGHPNDDDSAHAHGNADLCEHVDHLRVGRRRGRTSRQRQSSRLQRECRCVSWPLSRRCMTGQPTGCG